MFCCLECLDYKVRGWTVMVIKLAEVQRMDECGNGEVGGRYERSATNQSNEGPL